MKAITLHQPYALGMALGLKRFETRGRLTHFRGELAIHAALKNDYEVAENFHHLQVAMRSFGIYLKEEQMVFGSIVAVVNVTQCVRTGYDKFLGYDAPKKIATEQGGVDRWAVEKLWGNYTEGRFAWITDKQEGCLPIRCRGKQGFFNVDCFDNLLQ